MDVKRIVLFSSLAVVAYLLVLQWNQDYPHPSNAGSVLQSETTVNTQPNPNQQLQEVDSLLEFGQQKPTSLVDTPETDSNQTQLIQVVTDTFDLRIDPRGGDLVYAALLQHKAKVKSDEPFVLLQNDSQREYLVQSDLIGLGNKQRLNLNSAKNAYFLEENQQELKVTLSAELDNARVNKTFTFTRGSHLIKVDYLVENLSDSTLTTSFIGLIKRDASADPSQNESLGMKAFLGGAFSTDTKRYQKIDLEDFRKKSFEAESLGGWAAMLQHYFISAWIPPQNEISLFKTDIDAKGKYALGFRSADYVVEPAGAVTLSSKLYVGPKIQDEMKAIAPNLELTVDYGWLWFIAQPLFWLLDFIHDYVGNWGVAIILVTVVIKAAFYKLSATAYRSMANMRRLAPKLARIKEEAGDDRQKLSQQMMELYRKEKINPMGGCLPILVQMPVFIALYWMLMESVELRHAPFFLWIADLSMKDPYFVLPILMGASMFIQQLLNPAPPDPLQAKIMRILPIVFTFFFLFFPAGLVLYWVVNNILSILQQWYITRKIDREFSSKEA